mgnify:FL=1
MIQLLAALKHHKLYLAAVSTPGNEIRLGGHEAPPRIFSVFLGTDLTNFLNGDQPPRLKNLRDVVGTVNYNVSQ